MESQTAESIFELLTAKNPAVNYPKPTSKTNTSCPAWYTPRQLKHWDEFKFQALEAIYRGELMDQALRKSSNLPPYPYLKYDVDCVVDDEPTTIHLLTKWNHTIVTASLDAVKKFQPCNWVPKARTTQLEEIGITGNDIQQRQRLHPRRQSTRYERKKASVGMRPDAGGSLPSSTDGMTDSSRRVESFPKEYKTASKWNSSVVLKKYLIEETGTWRPKSTRRNELMPIRQIYSYCVRNACRYGCILTTGEAFIFRIRPRIARPGEIFHWNRGYQYFRKPLIGFRLGHCDIC